jgi:hypothetical protein
MASGRRARKRGGKGGRQSRHHEEPLREFASRQPRRSGDFERNKALAQGVMDEWHEGQPQMRGA